MMNQRPPMTGQRSLPFDGPVKGVGDNFMANAGSFPPQQGPSNVMANGPQQVQMNGVSSQQDPNRYHPGFYQQPKQPLPPKAGNQFQGALMQQPSQRLSPAPHQPLNSSPTPTDQQKQQFPPVLQHQQPPMPGEFPQQQQPQSRPGLPPQQQQPQRPGGFPYQQTPLQPGGPSPYEQPQRPGMPPQPSRPMAQTQGQQPPRAGGANLTQQYPPLPQGHTSEHQHQQMTQQMSNLNINSSQSQPPSSQQPNLGSWPPQPSTTQVSFSGPPTTAPQPSHLGSQMQQPTNRPAGPPTMPSMPPMTQPGFPPQTSSGAPPMGGMTQPSMGRPNATQMQPMPGSFPGPQGQSMYPGAPTVGGMPPTGPGQHGMGHPTPMNAPMQQQRRIDPDQMPSPIQVMKDDNDTFKDSPYLTSTRGRTPPLVTSNFVVQDDGNCSPRFMRSTMYNIPCNKDLLQASSIPLATVITPFAEPGPSEPSLRIMDYSPTGPVRCNRCKAYMNPFVQFVDGGRRFMCNICSYSSEVPAEYFCHLDHQGMRLDVSDRPELHLGSYEFVATKDYCKDQKMPGAPAYVFMIDVSYQSMQCGMVRMLMKELKEVLDVLPKEHGQDASSVRVGFVTYCGHLHFYNVKGNLAQPQMMVVSDIEDVFVPLVDGFLVSPQEARTVIDSLLVQIPLMFGETRETETVLGPVIQAGMEALKAAGISGKLFVFHSSLPISEAPGKLKNREDRKLLGSEKEKGILTPQNTFYEKLAKDCVENGVGVDLFLFPNAYIDVATIGSVATLTGGQIYRYSYFKEATHGDQFRGDLKRNLERNVGFDAVMRLRCSTGLRPVDFWGNCYMNNTTDVELAVIDPHKAIAIEIKHDDKLPEEGQAYFQCALLYTSVSGQRRLRVHNLAFSTCTQLSDLFRCCEMDTFVNVASKQAIREVYTSTPKAIRENLMNQCAQILACYRRNCASPSSAGQLILPECMKLLPLYTNCILKNDILLGGSEMSSDDRSWLMRTVMSMDQAATVPYFYPRLFALHDLKVESSGLPSVIRCSADRMSENGVYLLENGISLFLWIGLQVDPNWLHQVFGVQTIGQVDIEMTSLPVLENSLSTRLNEIIRLIQEQRQHYLKLTVVRQRDKLEGWFKHFLVEDKGVNPVAHSYVDFLCQMHKEIRNLMN
ncbi:protein transport protein Sec24C-like isoform X2 [Stylophora pistillata]|uniref:protein transport protein Sec24C-like isoform X2 n=1 Tax=Stylophora pistillata TaxID=50429 RepID=UPI000C0485F0|nr:protein transport protein Sec24C-like isoform X2 [Stylophora pistillata]